MLTLPQIRKMICTAGYTQLIDRVLSNGRSGNLAIRLRLSRLGRAEAAALGLGLQRACELAYAPQPLHVELAERIIELWGTGSGFAADHSLNQSSADEGVKAPGIPGMRGASLSGSEGPESGGTPSDAEVTMHGGNGDEASRTRPFGVMAVVVRALLSYQSLRAQVGLPFEPAVEQAVDRTIEQFARHQQPSGSICEDEVEDAIILWQLGRSERFRGAICWSAFRESVAQHAIEEGDPEVRRLALAAA